MTTCFVLVKYRLRRRVNLYPEIIIMYLMKKITESECNTFVFTLFVYNASSAILESEGRLQTHTLTVWVVLSLFKAFLFIMFFVFSSTNIIQCFTCKGLHLLKNHRILHKDRCRFGYCAECDFRKQMKTSNTHSLSSNQSFSKRIFFITCSVFPLTNTMQ